MTETYCFVCGELISCPQVAVLQGRKVSLKWLFIRICEILNICPGEEWDFLVNCENTQCCSNCYQLFNLIWETHQSLLQIQKNLQKYVREVEQSVQQSGGVTKRFHPKCTQFRQQFASCLNDTPWMIPHQINRPPRIDESLNIGPEIRSFGLKIESIVNNDPLEFLEEGDASTLQNPDHQKKDLLKSEATDDIDIVENTLAQELSHDNNTPQLLSDPMLEESGPEFADTWQDDEYEDERSHKQDSAKLKRKFKVIAEEDECPQELNEDSPTKEKKNPSKKRRKLKYPRNSDSGKILKCSHAGCSYTTQWPNNFARHAASHLSIDQRPDIVACPHCERKIIKNSLHSHILRLHRPDLLEKGPTCPECGKKFTLGFNYAFQLHLKTHSKERPFPCDLCGKRFNTKTNLDVHNRLVHESVDINLKCDLCDKSFTKKASFKKHWRDHHSDKPYPSHLVQCVAHTHPPPKPQPSEGLFKCSHDGCTFATPHKNNLRRHGYTHLPPEERPDMGQCSDCGIRLEMVGLKRHIKLCHSDLESIPFVICPECGRKFLAEDKFVFENHLKEHRGEKDFICEECGKGFVTKGYLTAHIKSSHEILDIDCEQCGKKFTKRPAYRDHWKRHHSQLPFPLGDPNRMKADKTLNKFNNYLEIEKKAKEMMPVRKWPCEWDNCNVVCVAKHTLDRHVLRVHHGVDVHAKWKKKKDDQPGTSMQIKPENQPH